MAALEGSSAPAKFTIMQNLGRTPAMSALADKRSRRDGASANHSGF